MQQSEIIHRYYQLDTCAISDAIDSFGISSGIVGIVQRVPNTKCVGFAYTVKYCDISHYSNAVSKVNNYIDAVPRGAVIVIDNEGRMDCTTWGNILTTYAMKNGIAGTIAFGAIRDVDQIAAQAYPVFSSAIFMQSAKGRAKKISEQCELKINEVSIMPNDLICADVNGCVVVPARLLTEVLIRAETIKETESKIVESIQLGMPLWLARKKFNYEQPWKIKQ